MLILYNIPIFPPLNLKGNKVSRNVFIHLPSSVFSEQNLGSGNEKQLMFSVFKGVHAFSLKSLADSLRKAIQN